MKKRILGAIGAGLLLVATVASAAVADPTLTIDAPTEGATISRSTTPNLTIAGTAAFDDPTQAVSKFYLRQDTCGEDNDNPHLSVTSGEDGGTGCGYLGGWNILTEVFTALGEPEILAADFPAADGVPLTYDGSQAITGTVVIQSFRGITENPVGFGVGQARAHFRLTGDLGGTQEVIGSATVEYLVTPDKPDTTVNFTIPANAALDKKDLSGLTLRVNMSGPAVAHGHIALSGASFVNLPVWTASFSRGIQVAIDSGAFASTGVTLNADGTWSATKATPAVGSHTIRARAVQGGVLGEPVIRNITVTN